MKSFFRSLFDYKVDPLEDYSLVLKQVLKWVLLVLMIIGVPAVTIGVIEAISLGQTGIAVIYMLLFLPLILVSLFYNRLNYKWGAAIVLFSLYLFAIHNMTIFGFSGAGIPIFLTFFILTTLFYGMRAGLFSIAAGLVPMSVIGYLMVHEIISVEVNLMQISTLPISWITAVSILFLMGILMVVGFSFIQQNFFNITSISKEQADELRKMNRNLKEEIRHKEEIQENLEKAKEKAEESDRLKSAFLKNMSHEIRTPMNGIMGFADLLEMDNLEEARFNEYVHMIKKSGNRMLELLNNLMDIAMIESGEINIQQKEIALNPVMDDLYSLFAPEAKKKGLSIICEKGLYDHNSDILTDSEKLKQILTNLLNNAVKYTHKGEITFGYEMEGESLRFYVTDTGIGISPQMQQKIFERFRQAELSVTREYDGAGLGLSISKAYVEMLGGRMWLDSTPEWGSTFYFTIPCHLVNTIGRQHVTPGRKKARELNERLKLLVAEDDETSYMLLQEIMNDKEITFLRAKNGEEALEKLNEHGDVDMVLMDIKMPVMDGYEATREIKKTRPELPVITQTAYISEKDREKAIDAGCDAYISKPINAEELMGWIQKLLSIDRATS